MKKLIPLFIFLLFLGAKCGTEPEIESWKTFEGKWQGSDDYPSVVLNLEIRKDTAFFQIDTENILIGNYEAGKDLLVCRFNKTLLDNQILNKVYDVEGAELFVNLIYNDPNQLKGYLQLFIPNEVPASQISITLFKK